VLGAHRPLQFCQPSLALRLMAMRPLAEVDVGHGRGGRQRGGVPNADIMAEAQSAERQVEAPLASTSTAGLSSDDENGISSCGRLPAVDPRATCMPSGPPLRVDRRRSPLCRNGACWLSKAWRPGAGKVSE